MSASLHVFCSQYCFIGSFYICIYEVYMLRSQASPLRTLLPPPTTPIPPPEPRTGTEDVSHCERLAAQVKGRHNKHTDPSTRFRVIWWAVHPPLVVATVAAPLAFFLVSGNPAPATKGFTSSNKNRLFSQRDGGVLRNGDTNGVRLRGRTRRKE